MSNIKKLMLASASLGLAVSLAGCWDAEKPATSTTAAPTGATTATVLAIAKSTSETADPFMVNSGVFFFTDTSEFTLPLSIDQ